MFFLPCVCIPLCASVYLCLVATCLEGLSSWLSFVVYNYEFDTFQLVFGSGVVLDCIDT